MEVYDLVNLDSEDFWKWWLGFNRKNEKDEYRPILLGVPSGTRRKNNYSRAV